MVLRSHVAFRFGLARTQLDTVAESEVPLEVNAIYPARYILYYFSQKNLG